MAVKTPYQNVTFPSTEGEAYGYLARPESGEGPGVIVVQEWWGLTDHIKSICDRLAAEGFVALAPDLFGGWTTHDSKEASELMSRLPAEEGARLLGGAVDYLLGQDFVTGERVGVIGFCMGGGFVLALAVQQGDRISAAVPFYGVGQGVPGSFSGLKAAVQGHYAEQDRMFPVAKAHEQAQQIRDEAGVEVEDFYYDAGHAFHNDENLMGTYNPELAKLAWGRAVAFLQQHAS
ncbi:carboxymethylenebutenolidase [Raineyella antarctica]|uniref:Carboxymethylenebutenolidase n=1 Tax=Raineyella antarctica TaxID=1577474 RepID=A0A1G6GP36_9ACTN|nr:dienelactone hydrolase family protein [Raineyella antarctica]SDB83760.1 carboxymethylenebutenolidase [Raineyella antarctica]